MTSAGDRNGGDEVDARDLEPDETRSSRTERTRAASLVNRLGRQLTALSAGDLDRLELPDRLRDEIDRCQRLKPRSRGRQNRLIGQLLRAEDHDAIRERVDALGTLTRAAAHEEKRNERWLVRLVDEGDPALEALIAHHPHADRQRLRVLMRGARQDPEGRNGKRARRELLRAVRSLRAGHPPDEW